MSRSPLNDTTNTKLGSSFIESVIGQEKEASSGFPTSLIDAATEKKIYPTLTPVVEREISDIYQPIQPEPTLTSFSVELDTAVDKDVSLNSDNFRQDSQSDPPQISDQDSDECMEDTDYIPSDNESDNSDTSEDKFTAADEKTNLNENSQVGPKRSRWNTPRPSVWKRHVAKSKRIEGKPYKSTTGRMQAPKIPKTVDCSKCRFKCQNNFSEENRKLLCQTYAMLSFQRQKDFILLNVLSNEVKSRRPRKGENSKMRSNTKSYFLTRMGKKIQMCQKFFCKTLSISNMPIINAFKQQNESGEYSGIDRRGRKIPGNKTSEEPRIRAKKHIESFPVLKSIHVLFC
ncbi:uncharacterized protein LOC126892997 [Diabrotica virgifera virgifera]|uniref:Uncharacterized protein n=1 Tax=Diabrotica virgifera virgifera TaxID=50390 RepID=A0ABM5L8Y2_DIAVI|nr:uncharacterized protein LOC126892997 [Diabrotica virgifera virgifera]